MEPGIVTRPEEDFSNSRRITEEDHRRRSHDYVEEPNCFGWREWNTCPKMANDMNEWQRIYSGFVCLQRGAVLSAPPTHVRNFAKAPLALQFCAWPLHHSGRLRFSNLDACGAVMLTGKTSVFLGLDTAERNKSSQQCHQRNQDHPEQWTRFDMKFTSEHPAEQPNVSVALSLG
ncbi:hypothetical protein OS493_017146 [Desmophyllum pertusum]|uniref:Uncharacterized protein n=1 Tax=Desmophyllum pertusum TaxID=174260 RepID=A0A9W9YCF9_9CNID|nr:hypothetical protein OS493_017146 [Desmophyllum pertusum]